MSHTFLHVVRVRKHTDMRELQAKHEDRLKMNMDKACNMNFVATPEQVASMTMKGQTKPIFSVSLTGVIAEEEQHV